MIGYCRNYCATVLKGSKILKCKNCALLFCDTNLNMLWISSTLVLTSKYILIIFFSGKILLTVCWLEIWWVVLFAMHVACIWLKCKTSYLAFRLSYFQREILFKFMKYPWNTLALMYSWRKNISIGQIFQPSPTRPRWGSDRVTRFVSFKRTAVTAVWKNRKRFFWILFLNSSYWYGGIWILCV